MPALSLKKQLESRGYAADIICLEDLYADRDTVIEETKKSFHDDFRLAKLSYRIPTRNREAVDPEAARTLKEQLAGAGYEAIVTFSGFWAGFLNGLAESCPYYEDRIFAVHMDASRSLSWKGAERGCIRDIWMYELESRSIRCMLEKSSGDSERRRRILVHGGGWGIGDYRNRIKQLNDRGYPLDIIVYYPEEYVEDDDMNEYYMLDPEWKPGRERDEYPRLLTCRDGVWMPFGTDIRKINPLRELMERDIAVYSKPGGGTLSDSLVTATPVIFGEELAYYEKDNRTLWTELGLGTDYDSFASSEDRDSQLGEMRRRLQMIRDKLPCAAEELI